MALARPWHYSAPRMAVARPALRPDGGRTSFNVERTTIRLALPSKGRMAEDTLSLLNVSMWVEQNDCPDSVSEIRQCVPASGMPVIGPEDQSEAVHSRHS